MKCLIILIVLVSAKYSAAAMDDYNVEQIRSPFVEAIDPGTHMTNRNIRSQGFQGLQGDFGPYSSSSKYEVREEQRYVNGQPTYESTHERRFEDGRLVHEHSHEKGHKGTGANLYGTTGTGYGTGSTGTRYGTASSGFRSTSSRSRYENSGGAYGSGTNDGSYRYSPSSSGSYGETGMSHGSGDASTSRSRISLGSYTDDGFQENFNDDVVSLRQRLHQGSSVIRHPVTGTSRHEEKRQETHFVDGQQVYHKNEEKRYEDGRLVYDVSEEKDASQLRGNPAVGATMNTMNNQQITGYQSSVNRNQASSSTEYNPPSHTSYRASYWRPGPQTRRVSTNTQRQSNRASTVSRPSAARRSMPSTNSESRTPYQGSYRSSTNRIRTEINKPAYRVSYTPIRTVERVPQMSNTVSNSQVSSSSTQRQFPSSGYRSSVSTTPRPIASQFQSGTSQYRTSYSNKVNAATSDSTPGQNYGSDSHNERSSSYSSSYQPNSESVYSSQPDSVSQSTATRRQFSTAYGSGRYVRPTEAPASSQTTSRITDSYSEPYSVRSSSYQPSRFANYFSWSHWKKDYNQPSQLTSVGSESSQSRHHNSNSYTNEVNDRSTYSSKNNYGYPSGSQTAHSSSQSQTVRTLMPGLMYDKNSITDIDRDNTDANGYYRSQDSRYTGQSSNYPSSSQLSQTNHASSTYTSSTNKTANASTGTESGKQVDLSIIVDIGEGESVRLGSRSGSQENAPKRYDISPLTDGGVDLNAADNEVDTRYSGGSTRSSSSNSRNEWSYSESGNRDNLNFHNSGPSTSGRSSFSSESRYDNMGSAYNTGSTPISGSSYDRTTRVRNSTTNTLTSHVQPLVSSYKLESRTSKRYLNGKLVSEKRFNRYYENGILIHENQTERSRDEMLTDGVDVESLDLTMDDMRRYGMMEAGALPVAHSQRFEMRQEKKFVNGDQVFESTHEKHYQDGELVYEDHDEKDQSELIALGRYIHSNNVGGNSISGQVSGGGTYTSNFIENRNYGSSYDTGTYEGRPRGGNRQNTGIGESVTVSLTPRTKTRKTEIRREQEYQDGEQVYDLRHERQFEDGHLVHEDLSEKGPDELGTSGHRDALQDIISGRTLATASQSRYAASTAAAQQSQSSRQYQGNSYVIDGTVDTLNGGSDSYDYSNTQNSAHNQEYDSTSRRYQGATVPSRGSQGIKGQIGTNLLTSGSLTSVIGGGGAKQFDSLSNAPNLNIGTPSSSSTSSSTSETRYGNGNTRQGTTGGGYYAMFGNSGSGYGGVGPSSHYGSSSEHSLESSSRTGSVASEYGSDRQSYGSGTQTYGRVGEASESGYESYGSSRTTHGSAGYEASASFGAHVGGHGSGQAITHRREMEVEEHYENGKLVSGREEDKEWKNDNLLRDDLRSYGEGEARRGSLTSSTYSPSFSSSSRYDASGSSRQGASSYGASSAFGAQTSEHGTGFQSSGFYGGNYPAGHGAVTHRREMEMEEHYENGQLVSGREEDKEWNNDDLVRHDYRSYGTGSESSNYNSQPSRAASRPSSSSSSSYSSSSSSSSRSNALQGGVSSECSGHPCRNGGSCITGIKGFVCVCTFGFKGSVCQESYCPKRYCRHDGICQAESDGSHYCSCPVNYTGPRCERLIRNRGFK